MVTYFNIIYLILKKYANKEEPCLSLKDTFLMSNLKYINPPL